MDDNGAITSDSQAPTRKALNWGDKYLELAVRCYAAALLSDADIARRVARFIGIEVAP